MIYLLGSVVLFSVVHLTTAFPNFKTSFKNRFGAKSFGPAFGISSLLTLVLIIFAWRAAPSLAVYEPPLWGTTASYVLTLIGFLSLGVFLFRGSWRNHLRYPIGIAVLFWAAGHLLVNGDQAGLVLFGGLGVYAILHMAVMAIGGAQKASEVRQGHDLLSLFAGLAIYGIMVQLHYALIGVAVFQLTN